MLSTFVHKQLGVPLQLYKGVDTGKGTPVVLLHGIGRSAQVWQPLVTQLKGEPYRVVAFDLLGSGASPKPDWLNYDIDDHARSVIASLRRNFRFKGKVILIGHSLGALVALRVARLRPDLVKHVILYEMPLYEGLPEKRHYKARLSAYYAFYEWATKQNPGFGEAKKRFTERVATKVVGAELTRETWQPFIKSLKNSIMRQTAASDIRNLKVPADVIYGSRDMLVIKGTVRAVFGKDVDSVKAHTIKARHRITIVSAKFIHDRIVAVDKGLQLSR